MPALRMLYPLRYIETLACLYYNATCLEYIWKVDFVDPLIRGRALDLIGDDIAARVAGYFLPVWRLLDYIFVADGEIVRFVVKWREHTDTIDDHVSLCLEYNGVPAALADVPRAAFMDVISVALKLLELRDLHLEF